MGTQFPQISQVLNIVVVLVAVYATLSCVCSWIQERIASFFALRGWGLFRGIAQLTDDAFATGVFNHPIVAGTSPNPSRVVRSNIANPIARFYDVAASRPPSYLDARNFSLAFWQQLAAAHLPNLSDTARMAMVDAGRSGTGAEAPSPSKAADSALALSQLVVGAPTSALAYLEDAVRSSPSIPRNLQIQSLALLSGAGNDYAKLLAATDGWFSAQMDRASGWYKRQTQWIVFVIAAFVVSFTGVDTLDVLKVLSATDPCTLARYAHDASSVASDAGSPTDGQRDDVVAVPTDCTGKAAITGFNVTIFGHPNWNIAETWSYHDDKKYFRWPGLLLTLIALTLGGPFWFDALKTLVNVRSAGRRPERSDQPPK